MTMTSSPSRRMLGAVIVTGDTHLLAMAWRLPVLSSAAFLHLVSKRESE